VSVQLPSFFLLRLFPACFTSKTTMPNGGRLTQDFYLQGIQLPPRITVSACPEDMISRSWLFADMQRYYRISVTAKMGNEYLIIDKKSNCIVPPGYQKVHRQPTRKYILYQKTPPETKKNE